MNYLVRHPSFGSIWLMDGKIEEGYVVGSVWDESGVGSPMLPDDYRGEEMIMNFPVSYIAKQEESNQ